MGALHRAKRGNEMREKDIKADRSRAHQANGHLQRRLTTLNTVLHGRIDSQLKTAFLLGLCAAVTTIKRPAEGIFKGREGKDYCVSATE